MSSDKILECLLEIAEAEDDELIRLMLLSAAARSSGRLVSDREESEFWQREAQAELLRRGRVFGSVESFGFGDGVARSN